jgi:hypothetical protein
MATTKSSAVTENCSDEVKKIINREYTVGFLWFSVYNFSDSLLKQNQPLIKDKILGGWVSRRRFTRVAPETHYQTYVIIISEFMEKETGYDRSTLSGI